MNDIVRDLKLSKNQAELFGSRLKSWNFLREDTKLFYYRGGHKEFKDSFQGIGEMFYNDYRSVMEVSVHDTIPDQWRLFFDLSKVSLKVALLHNGNKFFSDPVAHTANMKES
jgi:hypothetical protein